MPGPDEESLAAAGASPMEEAALPPRWTFSQRLAVVYGAVSLVILLCAGIFTWWQAELLSARNEELAVAETRRMAERVGSALAQARQGVSVLAVADPLAEGPEACERQLNAAHLTMDAIVRHLFVVGPGHRIVCSTLLNATGFHTASSLIRTAELTGRPVTGLLSESELGLGRVIGVAHPLRNEGRPAGVVGAAVSVEELRNLIRPQLPAIPGLRVLLTDSNEARVSLTDDGEPIPPPPPTLTTSFITPERPDAGVATDRGTAFIQARVTDDLLLVATMPEQALRAGAPLEVALPPLLLALVLLGGMGALFWSVQRFVVAPLEAATRRLEAPDGAMPGPETEDAASDVADLIRRLGATRATRDEAILLRDMLLREAHHRIKNHLALVASFLRLQERQLSDHAALQALRAAQGRMMAIAKTYELLHDGPGNLVALDQTLERFARALAERDMTEGNAAQVQVDLKPLEVPADVAVKVALVVNELATNALKYAFIGRAPGEVRIVLRPEGEGGFTLKVSDNGSGLPNAHRRGLGMTVVDSLVRGIDARLDRLPGPGTSFLITWVPRTTPASET
ncbi:sensor histidine kinase [Roseomonas sp. SSH11]|uniref:histidine kinase n=1 Tax=Pararoseomonas baculiformis TaxID=2820812 RepID=A0ABS4AGJ1_9PROT|nr:sensor histidine kinase [Pararoseomonas baculiformis]MBP0446116.1 sensor histidine kinase [Pararoseomonas baculiformis]